jgi:hypothetical protein
MMTLKTINARQFFAPLERLLPGIIGRSTGLLTKAKDHLIHEVAAFDQFNLTIMGVANMNKIIGKFAGWSIELIATEMGSILIKAIKIEKSTEGSITECKIFKPSYSHFSAANFIVVCELKGGRYRVADFGWDEKAKEPSLPRILLQTLESPKTVANNQLLYGSLFVNGQIDEYQTLFCRQQYIVDIFPVKDGHQVHFQKMFAPNK